MQLKENYKDPLYDGAKKYRITQNEDGSSGIVDTTQYTQEGDRFGAKDINATNAAINRLNHVTEVTLTSSGWTGDSPPYIQTVSVAGATAEDEAILVSALPDGSDEETQKAYAKAFGIVSCGTASIGDGTATFKAYKKPATDITVGIKGV